MATSALSLTHTTPVKAKTPLLQLISQKKKKRYDVNWREKSHLEPRPHNALEERERERKKAS